MNMIMKGCRCFHHGLGMVLAALVWLSAIGFFWAEWAETLVMGFDSTYFFQAAVLFAVMAFSTKFCGCCRGWYGKMMGGSDKMDPNMCKHDGCNCGNCSKCC